MKKSFTTSVSIVSVLGLIGMLVGSTALATDTASVTATVTVQNVAIDFNTASPTSITWGTLGNNTASSTNPGGTITMKNTGNIAEDFQLQGQNSGTGKSGNGWDLKATAGTDEYVQKYCSTTCGTPFTNYTALTTSYTDSVVSNIAANGTQALDFQITTPNPSTKYTSQSVDISIRAVAH